MKNSLYESAQYVKGVGPHKYTLLNKLGMYTIYDLLTYFPFRYEDRGNIKPISELITGEAQTLKGEVLALRLIKTKYKKMYLFEMAVGDKTATIYATWFNQPYMRRFFKVGDHIILYGKVERYGKLGIINPEFELIEKDDTKTIHAGRIVPIYHMGEGVKGRFLRSIIKKALDQYGAHVEDCTPPFIRNKHHLTGLGVALKDIHFPQNFVVQEAARRRLVFDEFFFFEVSLAVRKWKLKIAPQGIAHSVKGPLTEEFLKTLPFELTDAQKKVLSEITGDMSSAKVMNRLLQGDVGSGKTVVCAYCMIAAIQSGYQAVLMSPTELLAEQHFNTIKEFTKSCNIKIGILVSSLPKKEKESIKEMIQKGTLDIVIGTHALLQENIEFKKLSLIIIDEQHKFGVKQRNLLKQKGVNPDMLVVSATPIPRTLALTLYGDLDISIIDELPKGRNVVKTFVIDESQRTNAYEVIRNEIKEGRQGYVIYPLVEESEVLELKAAKKMLGHFRKEVFPDLRIGLIHGKLNKDQRDRVMNEFKMHSLDLLVSTTVIEVGIDIPNATFMLIEHAERFGLSQLHQMRGRIARSPYEGTCILLANMETDESKARLTALTNTTDGFTIAEEDLKLRGPGDFFGLKQHGFPEFKIANLVSDAALLHCARREAFETVRDDPAFKKNPNLKLELIKRFGDGIKPYL
ncbi:MAG: ATP-dependent DNA helicase RecG [Candidatus Omnitrophota bacterium]